MHCRIKDNITYKIKCTCTHITELSDLIPLLYYFKTSAFNSYWPSKHIRSTIVLYHKMNCLTPVKTVKGNNSKTV